MSALKRVFEKFDENKDGKLSLDEFRHAFLAFFPTISQMDRRIVKVFKEIDMDSDRELNAEEFTFVIETMLEEMFALCDVDGDGKIPVSEFMAGIGKTCTEESCAEKVRAADADGDGYLNFEEFMALAISDIQDRPRPEAMQTRASSIKSILLKLWASLSKKFSCLSG